ncbi:MAG: hypothetical protein PVJ49_12655 [Acidobacteriota bacterium]|jgi:hypothetical protein
MSNELQHRAPAGLRRAAILLAAIAAVPVNIAIPGSARAATSALTAVSRVAAPLVAHLENDADPPAAPQQEQDQDRPPPVVDPINGPVISIFVGSIFSGSSALQTGGAFAYFFGAKASVGFEVEGNVTFGPAGRVGQGMVSFMWQTGARTSKFVPYFAGGAGYLHATSKYPAATQEVLDEFGIDPEPKTEQGPFFQFGGGLRFYVKPNIAFRGDVRFAYVPLDLELDPGFWNRLFGMRRIAGMVSWDF